MGPAGRAPRCQVRSERAAAAATTYNPAVTATYLASGDVGFQAGYSLAAFGIPAVGLILLIVGIKQRSGNRRQPGTYPPPPGLPANTGYPGPPPPPGPYPGYPAGFAPPPRAGSPGTALIVIGAVLLMLGALGIVGRLAAAGSRTSAEARNTSGQVSPSSPASSLQVGQCIGEFTFRTGVITSAAADCGDPESVYELAARGGPTATCPDGKQDGSVYDRLTNESVTLCFVLNLKQGQCYMRMQGGPAETLSPVDCTDTRFAQLKVAQRTDGSTDTTQCPPGAKAISYPTPARLYCLVSAGS
jgi:hypothetical protein